MWDLAGQGEVENTKLNYPDHLPSNKQPGNTAVRKRMNGTDLMETSGDTKVICILRKALQPFTPEQWANEFRLFWGKPQKQERNFSLVSHRGKLPHILTVPTCCSCTYKDWEVDSCLSITLATSIQISMKTKYQFSVAIKRICYVLGKWSFSSAQCDASSKAFLFSVLEEFCAFSPLKKAVIFATPK